MSKQHDWKERLGVVYSTNSDFSYDKDAEEEQASLPPRQQKLKVMLDKKQRKGKSVTLITGFIGTDEDLKELARHLKTKCGVGGSAKEGEIIIQRDFCSKVLSILQEMGYQAKRAGG